MFRVHPCAEADEAFGSEFGAAVGVAGSGDAVGAEQDAGAGVQLFAADE
ncbi:hypothetical protein [Streptomyces sp. DH8]|nr:hypothetical protein [Streptomyces sp. DH8]